MKVRIKLSPKLPAVFRRHPSVFLSGVIVLSLGLWAVVIGTIWYARDIIVAVPAAEELRGIGSMDQATTLFDRTDKPAFTIFKEQRIDVPLARVSPHLINAILAIEDQRFYDHNGIDVVRVAGAALSNLREGRRAQGGSTITQHLPGRAYSRQKKPTGGSSRRSSSPPVSKGSSRKIRFSRCISIRCTSATVSTASRRHRWDIWVSQHPPSLSRKRRCLPVS